MKKTFIIFFSLISITIFGQNKNISNGIIFDGEPYLSINPNNSQHMVAAWMGYQFNNQIVIKTRVTFDAGNTWSTTKYIPHKSPTYTSADPSLQFDNSGNLFLAYIDYKLARDSGTVLVTKSTDGGLNWGTPVKAIDLYDDANTKFCIDRPWMVIDQSNGPNQGTIYVTTMNGEGASPTPFNPYLVKSTNGGNSFSPYRYIDSTGYLAGSLVSQPMPTPSVGSDGTFYAIYPSYVVTQNPLPQFFIASSSNTGNSFNYNTVYTSATTFNDSLAKKGYLLISNPANANHLAFFFLHNPNGDGDIYMLESLNKGASWGTPQKINDDVAGNGKMQDMVWADFDDDGDLVVAWRDRRNASGTGYQQPTEIYAAVRKNGSGSFAPNFKISDQSVAFDTVLNGSGNDFMCIKLVDDTLSAVWGDTRNGRLNIWFQRIGFDGTILSTKSIASEKLPQINIYPNPTKNYFSVESDAKIKSISILDVTGKVIRKIDVNDYKYASKANDLPSGIYQIIAHTAIGTTIKSLVID